MHRRLRRFHHPRHLFRQHRLPPLRRMLRRVPEYTPAELQAVLELYAHLGHMGNSELQAQLDDGSLAKKVAMMTSGRGADVFRIAEQM